MGSPTTKDNLCAFRSRPWEELTRLDEEHWREALEADPLATFRASTALWELLDEQGLTLVPEARQADFAAHLRSRALLDRAAHAFDRNGTALKRR